MINLLPTHEKERLHREYALRVTVVSLFLSLLLLFVANVLLVPSYILSSVKLSITKEQVGDVQQSTVGKQKERYKDIVHTTNERVRELSRGDGMVSVKGLIGDVAKASDENVQMTGILYQADTKGSTVQLRGVARDRNALISLQERLQALHIFTKVELPVSSLVSDMDIHFTMNLEVDESDKT